MVPLVTRVLVPVHPQPIPAVIIVHGETWPGGVERELVALNGYLAARYYLVIAMSDPLQTGRTFEAAREDMPSTIDYVKAHASELDLHARPRLVFMGQSRSPPPAGGLHMIRPFAVSLRSMLLATSQTGIGDVPVAVEI